MPAPIHSRQNSRVRDLRAALRAHGTAAGGRIAIEGPHLLQEALRSGLVIESAFLREDRTAFARDLPAETEVVVLSAAAFDSASTTQNSQGVAAIVEEPTRRYLPREGDLLLVAAGVQDPGNLGTLIRSAEAFGAAAVLLAENTASPWNSKALRASAGSSFRLPLPLLTPSLTADLRACGIRLLAAVAHDGKPPHQADLQGGCALMIGSEGNGLSAAMLALADGRITLSTTGKVESLNAAVAGSLLLYEAARQRTERASA